MHEGLHSNYNMTPGHKVLKIGSKFPHAGYVRRKLQSGVDLWVKQHPSPRRVGGELKV